MTDNVVRNIATASLKADIERLRAERDSLLLKDRKTKNSAAHQRRYREVTAALNETAKILRQRLGIAQ